MKNSKVAPLEIEFEQEYWQTVYEVPGNIDGIDNSMQHARYIAAMMAHATVPVLQLADFGAGYAKLARDVRRLLKPSKTHLYEPSEFMRAQYAKMRWMAQGDVQVFSGKLQDLKRIPYTYQLGLCNSILQYIPSKQVEQAVAHLAASCCYLYLAVPVKTEYKKMLPFVDKWAYQRSTDFYRRILQKHFRFVGFRFLESKQLVSIKDTWFDDEIFRF